MSTCRTDRYRHFASARKRGFEARAQARRDVVEPGSLGVGAAEKLVDGGLGAGRCIDPLDDDRAVETVAPIRCGQCTGDDYRAGWLPSLQHRAAGAIVDAGALADEDT